MSRVSEPAATGDPDATVVAHRWAELWNIDFAAMIDEVYAPDGTVVHAGHHPNSHTSGRAELRAAEASILAMIPDHRLEILRVVQQGRRAVVEALITGTTPGDAQRQACPTCVWWDLDTSGYVARETAYWEWAKRRADDGSVAGIIVAAAGEARYLTWYREQADRLAALWTSDPLRMVDEMYAADCVVERLGEGPDAVMNGREALRSAERALLTLLPPPQRRQTVLDVIGQANVVAIAFTIEGRWCGTGPLRRGPGSLVLTLGDDDRIVSDRTYWHWSRAREVAPGVDR